MKSIEVSSDELQEMSHVSGQRIDVPGNRAGWARCTVNGQQYRAFVLAPGVTQ